MRMMENPQYLLSAEELFANSDSEGQHGQYGWMAILTVNNDSEKVLEWCLCCLTASEK